MKIYITLIALILIFSSQSSFALTKDYYGYLKSGNGLCSITIDRQNDFYHQLLLRTPDMNLRAVNLELKNNKIIHFTEIFEKDGDDYLQLYFAVPLPKLYKVTMKNLGHGNYHFKKTTLIFGKETISRSDICITQH